MNYHQVLRDGWSAECRRSIRRSGRPFVSRWAALAAWILVLAFCFVPQGRAWGQDVEIPDDPAPKAASTTPPRQPVAAPPDAPVGEKSPEAVSPEGGAAPGEAAQDTQSEGIKGKVAERVEAGRDWLRAKGWPEVGAWGLTLVFSYCFGVAVFYLMFLAFGSFAPFAARIGLVSSAFVFLTLGLVFVVPVYRDYEPSLVVYLCSLAAWILLLVVMVSSFQKWQTSGARAAGIA